MIRQPRRHLGRKYSDFVPIFNDFTPKVCGKGRAFRADAQAKGRRLDEPLGRRDVRQSIVSSIRELAQTFARAFDPYRPELHYMRGPGPKWHAKRAALAASASRPMDIYAAAGIAAARA
jgi:hypothetical protein